MIVSDIRTGPVQLASILRTGNGRPATPVRYHVAWTEIARRLGAPTLPPMRYRQEAEAAALQWAMTTLEAMQVAAAPAVYTRR